MPDKLDEKELLRLARAGGEQGKDGLSKLYELYQPYVEDQAARCLFENEDLDEFCQEVWKRVIEGLPKYRGETLRGLLGQAYFGAGKPEGIIGYYYLEYLRHKSEILQFYSKHQDRPDDEGKPKIFSLDCPAAKDDQGKTLLLGDIIPDESPTPLEIAIDNERRQIIKEAIEKLPKGYRYIVYMRYFDNRPVKDIAMLMDIKEEQVYLCLSRACQMLKGLLEKKLGPNPLEEINIYSAKKKRGRKI
ncbi:MAG: sigma-70 family RNA polymerase sigma factor [Planctomycetes bacterium]|nr:sigma-70 family RNA polymerase sigma factor [Planctomycetota bacterium]